MLRPYAERATGFEPVTSSLGSWHSTPELRPPVFEQQRREAIYVPGSKGERRRRGVARNRRVSRPSRRPPVPPCSDPRSVSGHLERLIRPRVERRHLLWLRRQYRARPVTREQQPGRRPLGEVALQDLLENSTAAAGKRRPSRLGRAVHVGTPGAARSRQ